MNTSQESSTSEYLLLFRGADWDRSMSPDQVQHVMDKVMAWFDSVEASSKGGHPLLEGGRVVSGKNGHSVVDGPFAESKDAVGGYILIEAGSYDEALALARTNPALEYGLTIEIRQIATICPSFERARAHSAVLTA